MPGLLAGKSAVVTGSSRGLGKAFAMVLAREGASVVVNGTVAADVNEVAETININGGRAVASAESVASWEGARRIIQSAVDNFGRIDILVNNAGIMRNHMLFNMTEEEWDDVISVHLKGTLACSRFASGQMRKQRNGRIISVVGGSGLRGFIGHTNYSAAKAGIIGMTRTWSLELTRYNITVNAIHPNLVRTRLTEPTIAELRQASAGPGKPALLARELGFCEPEDIAPLVAFLASDEAQWISGQVICLNGPRLALWSHPRLIRPAFAPDGWTLELIRKHFKSTVGAELESPAPDPAAALPSFA